MLLSLQGRLTLPTNSPLKTVLAHNNRFSCNIIGGPALNFSNATEAQVLPRVWLTRTCVRNVCLWTACVRACMRACVLFPTLVSVS